MALTPSPDNPIHKMKTSEFAHLIQDTLFLAVGGREHGSQQRMPDGGVESSHFPRMGTRGERHIAERDNPPDDPEGPPMSQMASTMKRETKYIRAKQGMKPSFSGGIRGTFGEMHMLFIGAGAAFGKALDEAQLGNDDAQKARIAGLMAQWSDNRPSPERFRLGWDDEKPVIDYAAELANEMAAVKEVPVKLMVDGKPQTIMVENVRIGEHNAPLAQVLYAVGKNSISLTERPGNEIKFLTEAASNFANILTTTDQVHDYLKEQLAAKGIANPDKVLKDNKLSFDSERAEEMILTHAPMLKLSDVIAPLVYSGGTAERLNPILKLVGEESEPYPPVINAEHGARLLEAILYRVAGEADAAVESIDHKAIRTHLRSSAMESPFELSRLADNDGVQKMFELAQAKRGEDPDLDRALETFERAIQKQYELDSKYDSVRKAVTYEPNTVERWRDHLREGKSQSKRKSNLLDAIDSGMNKDAFDAIMASVIDKFTRPEGPPNDKSFSDLVRDEMKKRAARAQKDVPPLPS
jgi:hypothetical protein